MITLTKEMLYQITINEDNRFDLYVDGSYHSCRNWVNEHLEMLADVHGVDISDCQYESHQHMRLIDNGVRVQVKAY